VTTELQQNRYDQLVRRVGGLIGPGAKVAEALSELFPTIDVENLPGELMKLAGWTLAFGASSRTAAGGQFVKFQVFNPVGSGNLIVVDSFSISTLNAQTVSYSTGAVEFADPISTQLPRDTRFGVGNPLVGQINNESTAGVVPLNGIIRTAADVYVTVQPEHGVAVLAPGTGFNVGATMANTGMFCSFFWRERPALQSELNF